MANARQRRVFDRALARFIENFLDKEIAQVRQSWMRVFDHPKLWGVVGLCALAVSFSQKVSIMATWACLALAWATWTAMVFAIRIENHRVKVLCGLGLSVAFGIGAVIFGRWLVPAPKKAELVFSFAIFGVDEKPVREITVPTD